MRLVYSNKAQVIGTKGSGDTVEVGDEALTFRGESVTVTGIEEPRNSGSTGRIYVRFDYPNAKLTREFFPGVIGAEWIEREDRA